MGVTLGGHHCLCPKNEGAKRVLDLGTGSGIWAIEYGRPLPGRVSLPQSVAEHATADAHPEADVIGVDLSPVQPHL
jgi:methylase of polypeptide subunit release factors